MVNQYGIPGHVVELMKSCQHFIEQEQIADALELDEEGLRWRNALVDRLQHFTKD